MHILSAILKIAKSLASAEVLLSVNGFLLSNWSEMVEKSMATDATVAAREVSNSDWFLMISGHYCTQREEDWGSELVHTVRSGTTVWHLSRCVCFEGACCLCVSVSCRPVHVSECTHFPDAHTKNRSMAHPYGMQLLRCKYVPIYIKKLFFACFLYT